MRAHKAQQTPMSYHPGTGEAGCQPDNAWAFREAYPDVVWHYNPWAGVARHDSDKTDDPLGYGIHVEGEPVYAAD